MLKKGLFVIAVATILFLASLMLQKEDNANGWNLVWADQFNILNRSNWKLQTGGGGWGNHQIQYYTDRQENARIQNGQLVIEARKQQYKGMGYTSARMNTEGMKFWTYGKVEARIRLPAGKGIWPAFWMLGENIGQVGWPTCGEIDIMQHINTEGVVHGTIHWSYNGHAQYGKPSNNIDVTQYHVYSIQWNDQSIKWYVDGVLYLEANIANNINNTTAFHKPFFIILNLAVGGDWPGYPDESTPFPSRMYVDYIRVYQQQGVTRNKLSIRAPPAENYEKSENHLTDSIEDRDMIQGLKETDEIHK